jgi:hypothetical protein
MIRCERCGEGPELLFVDTRLAGGIVQDDDGMVIMPASLVELPDHLRPSLECSYCGHVQALDDNQWEFR